MADTFRHSAPAGSGGFGKVSGDPRAGRTLRRRSDVGVSRTTGISAGAEGQRVRARGRLGSGDAWVWEDPDGNRLDAGEPDALADLGSVDAYHVRLRAMAREGLLQAPAEGAGNDAAPSQPPAQRSLRRRGVVGADASAAADPAAQDGGDGGSAPRKPGARLGKAYADIAGDSAGAGGDAEPTELAPAARRYNLRRLARANAAFEDARRLASGGDGADAGDVAAGALGGTLRGRAQSILRRGLRKLGELTFGKLMALLGIPASVGMAIPLLVILPMAFLTMFSGCTSSQGSQGGGGKVAAIAEAEYSSGVAAGDYHRDDPKYWNFVFPGTPYVSGGATPWCACFVSWCANQAGLVESGIMHVTGGADYFRYYESNPDKGTVLTVDSSYTPQLGDILTYRGAGGSSEHVGIVSSITENGSFYTTEGNTSGSTVNRHYHQKTADGYGNTNWGMAATVARPHYPSAGVGSLTGDQATIARYLLDTCGYDQVHVAAIMGNMYGESGYSSTVTQGGESPEACLDPDNGSVGFGLCGWTAVGHKRALYKLAEERGGSVLDMDIQLEHLKNYLSTGFDAFFAASTVEDATYRFLMDFENPLDPMDSLKKRTDEAQRVYEALSAASAPSEGIERVIEAARSQLGVAYDWNLECHPNQSMDCSSLVWYAYTTAGYSIPRCQRYSNGGTDSMYWWCSTNPGWTTNQADLKAGDLLFWGPWYDTGHVALCIGNGQIIHANYGGVQIDSVYYSSGNFLGGGPIL